MSKLLSTPGDGILKTHISWEEIEQDVQNALKTKATFGPNKTVRNLSLGRGFTSRMALIEPDWQNGEDRLPKALIAKVFLLYIKFKRIQQFSKLDLRK